GRLRRIIASDVGENKEFARQYLSGELEDELTPQGTLAEKLRAGGAGIPAFYTITGAGTQIAERGVPWKYDENCNVVKESLAKDRKSLYTFGEAGEYALYMSLAPESALVPAAVGSRHSNPVYKSSCRYFKTPAAQSARTTIAEVEKHV